MPFIHRTIQELSPITSPCGPLTELSTAEDDLAANVVRLLATEPGQAHFHRETTEHYYIVSGRGFVWVDGDFVPVHVGSYLVIRPNTPHQVIPNPESTLEILVVATPPWRAEDEIPTEGVLYALETRSTPD
ncbi:MAG: cupin domain-containing protein [Candidatus Kerfeldbacteria bacterium]|nr:cupin domain-containing protein [Candidatus Kerfeldbacteria bacterium]